MSESVGGALKSSGVPAAATVSALPDAFRKRYREHAPAIRARGFEPPCFELRLLDRTSHTIGDGIEQDRDPAFSVRVATAKGEAALAALDELAIAEAYMAGDVDRGGDLITVVTGRPRR